MGEGLQIDFFVPDGTPGPRRSRGLLWMLVEVALIILAAALIIELMPLLLSLLGVAAVLAAVTTWRSARRRRFLLERFGRDFGPVTPRTYLAHLTAWFIGLLAFVPAVVLTTAFLIVAGIVLAAALFILFLASLFGRR